MQLVVMGSGYVGLVAAACLAQAGHKVAYVDIDAAKIEAFRVGRLTIYEPALGPLIKQNLMRGRLRFSTDVAGEVGQAAGIFIAVGTPSRPGDGHVDLSFVRNACKTVGSALRPGALVVIKSTVPAGTSDMLERDMRAANPELRFSLVTNPEFLREGLAVNDFTKPDRIIIGSSDRAAAERLRSVYAPMFDGPAPILFTDRSTAEMIKYASNAFLATKIGFINEIAELCEKVGANVTEVAQGMGMDGRIGPKFLTAGPGFGGSCFPKDVRGLIQTGRDHGTPMAIIEAVAASNEARKRASGQRAVRAAGGKIGGWRVALLGLAFKANTDDMRESPAIEVIEGLRGAGARVVAYDPRAMKQARLLGLDIEYAASAMECIAGADMLVVVTEWPEFARLDLMEVKRALKRPIVVDLRNVFDPRRMAELGFRYEGVGGAAIGAAAIGGTAIRRVKQPAA